MHRFLRVCEEAPRMSTTTCRATPAPGVQRYMWLIHVKQLVWVFFESPALVVYDVDEFLVSLLLK